MNMNKKGFTLIELMIVVAIIAILAMIAIPMYQRYIERSRNSATQNLLHQLSTAMEAYNVDMGVYVSDANSGLAVGAPRIVALLPYGFRVDPNVAFDIKPTSAIGGVTPPGFIACAVHRAKGSRLYAYDTIVGTGVMAMASLTATVGTPTVPAVTLNTPCTTPINLWIADPTNPTTNVITPTSGGTDVAVNATGTVD